MQSTELGCNKLVTQPFKTKSSMSETQTVQPSIITKAECDTLPMKTTVELPVATSGIQPLLQANLLAAV